jgi:hypothetical protein
MKKLCMMIVAAASLSACGGGSSFVGQPAPDAFLAEVMRVVALDGNTTPIDIDALVATMPENTEPVAVN